MQYQEEQQAQPRAKRAYKTRSKMSETEKLLRDLEAGYKANRKLLEKSLAACSIGTNSYLAHLKAMDDQFLKYAEFRREIGVIPKNVKTATTTSYVFKAHFAKDGNISTARVSDPAQMQELERSEARETKKGQYISAEDEAIRAAFEEQFSSGSAERRLP